MNGGGPGVFVAPGPPSVCAGKSPDAVERGRLLRLARDPACRLERLPVRGQGRVRLVHADVNECPAVEDGRFPVADCRVCAPPPVLRPASPPPLRVLRRPRARCRAGTAQSRGCRRSPSCRSQGVPSEADRVVHLTGDQGEGAEQRRRIALALALAVADLLVRRQGPVGTEISSAQVRCGLGRLDPGIFRFSTWGEGRSGRMTGCAGSVGVSRGGQRVRGVAPAAAR